MDLAEFLSKAQVQGLRKADQGYMARCPAHEDHTPSLSIGEGDDGRVLLHCHAGCSIEAIRAALNMTPADLLAHNGKKDTPSLRSKPRATVPPVPPAPACTLAAYSDSKGLPVDFLHQLGLRDVRYQKAPAIRVPYMDANGDVVAVRFRLRLSKGADGSDGRFTWKSGTKPVPYGLWRVEEARREGHIVIDEGESDAQTCWRCGIPALGLPGADSWREAWADGLDGIDTIYVIVEPDTGGAAMKKRLATSRIHDRVRFVYMSPEAKDVNAFYLQDRDAFPARWRGLMHEAIPWTQEVDAAAEATAHEAWDVCKDLASQSRILDLLPGTLSACGVAGEEQLCKLIYLALCTRFLERPVSLALKGPSAGGKSYLGEKVVDLHPPNAVYSLSGMSEHALAYLDEPLSHRFLALYEASGLQSDFANYLVRSLLSEGCIRYATVEKTLDGLRSRMIELEGPTGLLVTTTAVHLHRETETRLLSVTVTDTNEQTRAVLRAIAEGQTSGLPQGTVDVATWRSLQEWLETREHRVIVPFVEQLAELIPPVAVRLRRDFKAIKTLIEAHAILHQATRSHDAEGRIIATIDDYIVVRELVAGLVAEGLQATVSATTHEAVEAVAQLRGEGETVVTYNQLAGRLGLDRSAARRRARVAIDAGYLKNEETRRGQPAKLTLGEPMPEKVEILPPPEALGGGTVARDPEGIDGASLSSAGIMVPVRADEGPRWSADL